jgi:hypothetical protein
MGLLWRGGPSAPAADQQEQSYPLLAVIEMVRAHLAQLLRGMREMRHSSPVGYERRDRGCSERIVEGGVRWWAVRFASAEVVVEREACRVFGEVEWECAAIEELVCAWIATNELVKHAMEW